MAELPAASDTAGVPAPRLSERLAESLIESAADVGANVGSGRARRVDGWTAERIRIFLTTLAECGVVEDACRAAGMGKKSAYNLRNRAEGGAFRVAWDAAYQLARPRVADAALSRALHGCVELIVRDGKVVAERHRFDNRHTMSVLARLDRLCDANDEQNRAARLVAQEFDQFLDIACAGGEGAAEFLDARRHKDWCLGRSSGTVLGRLDNYRRYGAGLAEEIDVSDLDPADMAEWSEEQVERARRAQLIQQAEAEEYEDEPEPVAPAGQVLSALAAADQPQRETEEHAGSEEERAPARAGRWSEADVNAIVADVATYESMAMQVPAMPPPLPPGPRPPTPPRTGKLPKGASAPFDGPPPSGWVATD